VKKSYYAIIPANVRYDKQLIDGAKLLYGEITALCNQEGYCWATNSYFSELYEVSTKTISTWVNQLRSKGYITTEMIYKEGTNEIVKRYIRIVPGGMEEKVNTPMEEKVKGNSTLLNTTVNNTSNKDIVGQPDIPYKEIVNYLNNATGKKYRHTTQKTKDLIKARFNEKNTLEDFKTDIDNKVNDNKRGTFKDLYLRPETLFGTKFEGYLNQESPNEPTGYDPNRDAF